MKLPLVTIGIPVYNVEEYVEKSILSAINQIYPYIEIIIVDDCGNDNSMNIVRRIVKDNLKENTTIRIIEHPRNEGLGIARNTILDNAHGKYLYYLDSDDVMTEECIDLLIRSMAENDSDVVIGSVKRIDYNTGKCVSDNNYNYQPIVHRNAGIHAFSNGAYFHIEQWNKLYNLEFLKKNNIKCVQRYYEDVIPDLMIRIYSDKISFVPKTTLIYNIRNNSILTEYTQSSTMAKEKALLQSKNIIHMQKIIAEHNTVPNIYDFYYSRIENIFNSIIKYNYSKADIDEINIAIKNFNNFVPQLSNLKSSKYKFIYLCCKLNESIQMFLKSKRIFNLFSRVYSSCFF